MSDPITSTELKREIALYLGFSRDSGDWTTTQDDDLDQIVNAGERALYYTPLDLERKRNHTWSFLAEDVEESLGAGSKALGMPSDFWRLTGSVAVSGGGELGLVDEGHIRSLHAEDGGQGKPEYYALVRSGSHYSVSFYPACDQDYTLTARYLKRYTSILNSGSPPAEHSQLLLAACLAEAERTFRPELGEGVQAKRYQDLLQAAIKQDLEIVTRREEEEFWTGDEPSDDLSITKGYLRKLVGREFGYKAAPGTWSRGQAAAVEEALRSGLRMFYSPPVMPGERFPHQWSFIKATEHLDLVGDQAEYDLPEDFASLEGGMTYEPSSSTLYDPVKLRSESEVRKALQYNTVSSRPHIMAVRAKNGVGPTRWEVLFYPKPDQAYRLDYRYERAPSSLPDNASLPLGGQPHTQSLINACLAAVEMMESKKAGPRYEQFLVSMQSSIGHDRKVVAPDMIGHEGRCYDRIHHGLNDYLVDPTAITRS